MRALVYTAPGHVAMEDRPRPQVAAGECEIAVQAAGICGSDLSGFLGHSRRRIPPLVSCGRCAACLSGAQNLCVCWRLIGIDRNPGCFQEFVALPQTQIYEVPEDLPDAQAALAEPLANVVHLFRIAAPAPFFRMGIVGGGTMGSLALLTARWLGVREILVEDVSEVRLDLARKMGAALAVNTSKEEGVAEARRFAGNGLDLVLDASGTEPARQAAFDLCSPGGLVVLLGMSSERSQVDFVTSIRKEHRVAMSFAYTPVDFERSLALLKAGAIDLSPWTMELPLEEGQRAFDKMTSTPGETLKMLLRVS